MCLVVPQSSTYHTNPQGLINLLYHPVVGISNFSSIQGVISNGKNAKFQQ